MSPLEGWKYNKLISFLEDLKMIIPYFWNDMKMLFKFTLNSQDSKLQAKEVSVTKQDF